MSLHKTVAELFKAELLEDYPNVSLTNSDVNRIVTNVVQSFSIEKGSKEQVKEQTENYILRYKQRDASRDCGCSKK